MSGILQVLPSFRAGGVEQTTLLVANALAEKGFQSFILSSGGMLTSKLHPNVIHINLPLNTKNPLTIFSNSKKLKEIITYNNISIVHARSRAPAWSAYFAARSAGVHFMTTYHGAYSQNFFKWHYNRIMALGNPVIVTSQYMQEHVRQHYPKVMPIVIPSGINTDFFAPELLNSAKISGLRLQYDFKVGDKVVLLVGRFTRIKGHHILLQAAHLSQFMEQIHVIFVGDGQNPQFVEWLKNQAKKLSLKLHIYEDERDMRPFFSMADVVVVPTIKPEAFGRVTVEAMSMEKIVIVNDLGASKEVIGDNEWVFNHNCAKSLADKIDNAFSLNLDQAHKIGVANRLRAVSLYNIETLTEGHIRVYNEILKAE